MRFTALFEGLENRTLLSAAGGHADRDLGVATYNVYVGADVAVAIQAVSTGDPAKIIAGVTSYWQNVLSTDFHARAAAIAKQIDTKDPALVGLQEMASYFIGPYDPTTQASTPLLNFESELLGALSDRGLHYAVVSRGTNADIEFPGFIDANAGLDDLRVVDHDLILARTDLPKSQLKVSNAAKGSYATNLQFPSPAGTVTIQRGWVSVDAKVRGKTVRFIDTHIEPFNEQVQRAQAAEIVAGPAKTNLPVILAGDLNTAADGSTTMTYADLKTAGFADAWSEVRPNDPGFTDGQDANLLNPVSKLSERIDFVLLRGDLVGKKADRIGEEVADKTPSGLWPSDHAGVAVTVTVHPRAFGHGRCSPIGRVFSDTPVSHRRPLDELLAA